MWFSYCKKTHTQLSLWHIYHIFWEKVFLPTNIKFQELTVNKYWAQFLHCHYVEKYFLLRTAIAYANSCWIHLTWLWTPFSFKMSCFEGISCIRLIRLITCFYHQMKFVWTISKISETLYKHLYMVLTSLIDYNKCISTLRAFIFN